MTSHWQEFSASVGQATGTALPVVTATIPANGRLSRVVISSNLAGFQGSSQAFTFGPHYYLATLTLTSPGYANRDIWHKNAALNFLEHAFFITTGTPPNDRLYKATHWAGDAEIGDNLQMSWGGPGKPALTLKLTGGVFQMIPATQGFTVWGTLILRTLHYT